ncbi:MAG: hypothetical protein E6G08_18220 [Actinobacteria bacterium]|nr:MAG: hypothetical protein E6G08_18220 [Actinomycetota bacterium]
MGLVIGIDTGGTFTDMVVFDPESGHVESLKTSSIPRTPGQAIVNALDEGGIAASEIETFTHGTTVGTNALIERSTSNGSTARSSTTCAGARPSRSWRAAGSASAWTRASTPTGPL